MNAEMMQKLIEFGARQERSRAEFIAELIVPANSLDGDRCISGRFPIGMENQPISEPTAKPTKVAAARRGRKPNANGLATQIRALLADNTGGTAEDIAVATAEPTKKVVAALNSMKARGIVYKAGKCWSLAGGNGTAASI